MSDSAKALALASNLKGMDDSKVEVDDDQAPPTIAAGSPEEAALVSKLNEALMESGVMTKWEAFKAVSSYKDLPTMCLRGRKYDVSRGAELLPRLMGMIEELKLETEPGRLHEDIATRKILAISREDKSGRTIIWVRFRFHDPKVSPAKDVARLLVTTMLYALRDPDAQRKGVCLVHDMRGIQLRNLDSSVPRLIFTTVLPNLPIRVGRIILFNPPWIIGKVILPIVLTFMSSKLKSRLVIINGKPEPIFEYVSRDNLPTELGGSFEVDAEKIVANVMWPIILARAAVEAGPTRPEDHVEAPPPACVPAGGAAAPAAAAEPGVEPGGDSG